MRAGQNADERAGDGATIAASTLCLECGYELKGLPLGSVCPECAAPVDGSLRLLSLRHASVEHLRCLRSGIHLITGACFGFAGMILGMVIFFIVEDVSSGPTAEVLWIFVIVGLPLALFSCVVVHAIGIWRLSRQDPRITESEPWTSPRRLLRASLAVGTVAIALKLLSLLFELSFMTQRNYGAAMGHLLFRIATPSLVLALIFHMLAFGLFCRAVGTDIAASRLRRLGATMVIAASLIFGYSALQQVGFRNIFLGGKLLQVLFLSAVVLFPLFVMLLYSWLLDQLRIGLRVVDEQRMDEAPTPANTDAGDGH